MIFRRKKELMSTEIPDNKLYFYYIYNEVEKWDKIRYITHKIDKILEAQDGSDNIYTYKFTTKQENTFRIKIKVSEDRIRFEVLACDNKKKDITILNTYLLYRIPYL